MNLQNSGLPPEKNDAFQELMGLFTEKNYWERLRMMFAGLGKPRESGEYKVAHTELQRQMAPLAAVVLPAVFILLLVFLVRAKPVEDRPIIYVDLDPTVVSKVDLIKLDTPEKPPEFLPKATDFGSMQSPVPEPHMPQWIAVEQATPPADGFTPYKSPIMLVGVFGGPRGDGDGRDKARKEFDGSDAAESAVMRSLRWLKKNQQPDGSWLKNKNAMTALAVLCFLAHGEKPDDSAEFGDAVRRGIEFLLASQPAGGQWGGNYEHYIATYALCEAYGMTMNPTVRVAADRAVRCIIDGQHSSGGWDYALKQNERDDTSVMGWAAQALKAAQMADFYSDPESLNRACKLAVKGFQRNAHPDGGFGYTGPARGGLSSVGTLCMQFHHAEKSQEVRKSLELLATWKPVWVGSRPGHKLAQDEKPANAAAEGVPLGGSCQYYYYYGTQALFQQGGADWTKWNARMWPAYVEAQFVEEKVIADAKGELQDVGWWENADAHSDRPVMDTCLAALQLMVYYRYLPTFQVVAPPVAVTATAEGRGDIPVDTNL